MKLRLTLTPYRAAFARPILTARGPWQERHGLWIVVRDEEGLTGLGEVAPLPDWGTETLEQSQTALTPLTREPDTHFALSPGGWERDIGPPCRRDNRERGRPQPSRKSHVEAFLSSLALPPAAHAGLELALLDWLARRAGCPLAALLTPNPRARVRLNALITASDPAGAAREARTRVEAGFTTLKLKVGAQTLAGDLARLRAVREAVGDTIALRLDANGAWSREQAIDALRAFVAIAPEYVEQPVPADDPDGLAWVQAHSGVPVAADESLRDAASARRLMHSDIAALVLKPMALGGLTTTLALAREAEAAGKRVVITSALDRGIATLGALHLAAALAGDTAAGLATATLFDDGPLAPALMPRAGCLVLPADPGLGLTPEILKERVS